MRREEALERIARLRPQLGEMAVRSLFVLGSVARGDSAVGSDIDLLVDFDRPVGLPDLRHTVDHEAIRAA